MFEIETLEQNVDRIRWQGAEVILVGTAHVSHQSIELTERIIDEQTPDTIAVELCASRYDSMQDPNRWKNTDILTVLRSGKIYVLLLQLVLASYQKRLGNELQVKPGAEMMAAVKQAQARNIPLVLADREVKITLRRAWANTKFTSLLKLFFSSLYEELRGLFRANKKEAATIEAEIERLKNPDALDEMMREFATALPDIKAPLIDERDFYLASKIKEAAQPGKKIIAILGAGHVPGIKKIFLEEVDRAALELIPPPSITSKIIGIFFPAFLTIALIAGFFWGGKETTMTMAGAWILYTGLAAAIGALLSLAHPLSILAAGVSAPITTVHPLLAAGWVAGFVEAWIRKPQVKDIETVLDDIGTIRGVYRNRFARIFLVMILTNLVTSIGMIWGAKVVASMM
jgi:pheromone shutdown-related protein TraB